MNRKQKKELNKKLLTYLIPYLEVRQIALEMKLMKIQREKLAEAAYYRLHYIFS